MDIFETRGIDKGRYAAPAAATAFVLCFVVAFAGPPLMTLVVPSANRLATAGAGWLARLPSVAVASALIAAYVFILVRLPNRIQQKVVWATLALMFFGFFYSFNLSFSYIAARLPYLLGVGVVTTLYVSAISIAVAFVLALAGAVAKLSGNGVAMGIGSFYTSCFRGVPLLMQLFLIYTGLPQIGFVINPVPSGVIALALCYGAYMTEIFRSGINSIPKGQWEAADALGLPRSKTFRLVIMPQTMLLIVPPTGNQFIAMLKDSSLVSVVGVWDLMFVARAQGRAEFKMLEMLITASIIYWILSIVLELVQSRIERRFAISEHRSSGASAGPGKL